MVFIINRHVAHPDRPQVGRWFLHSSPIWIEHRVARQYAPPYTESIDTGAHDDNRFGNHLPSGRNAGVALDRHIGRHRHNHAALGCTRRIAGAGKSAN